MASNSSSNSSDFFKDYVKSKINFLLIATDECTLQYSKSYCYYSAFIVLCGYAIQMTLMPFILHRITQLKNKFRNQYSLSLLWICSILIMALIDLIEFIAIGNGKIYSNGIILIQCIFIFICIWTIVQFARYHSINGPAYYRAIVVLCFSAALFVLILIARIWSQRNLAKFPDIDRVSPVSFHILNTHFFFYYFIYAMFASVQVYQNIVNNFARCMTNTAYALWFVSSFMLGFYSDILPKRPAYDYIHYRNYFLISTIIVIILQDLNFARLKRANSLSKKSNIKTISMKQFPKASEQDSTDKQMGSKYQGLNYIESVFDEAAQTRTNLNDDEVTYFDVEQFASKGNKSVDDGLFTENDLIQTKEMTKLELFYFKYQNVLTILFVIVLIVQLLYSIMLLFKSVTFSHFKLITPFIHPVTILIAKVISSNSFKIFSN